MHMLCTTLLGCALFAMASTGSIHAGVFDIDVTLLSRPPLWEPTWNEYFGTNRPADHNPDGLPAPVVLTNPSREEFFFHARRGYPILVSDWTKGMHYDGWSGQQFAETFPFGYMKAEYIQDMEGFTTRGHDIKYIDGEMRFNIGTFKPDGKTLWYNYSRPASRRYADDPMKPQRGPYVWHVKDELTAAQKVLVQRRFQAPAFLRDPLNEAAMNRSFEVWFSPGGDCGAGAHADGYCESVVSVQLLGDKRWRKMMLPKMSFLDSFDEFDGGVYQTGRWRPDLSFVNKQGSAVIWPPGYLHETSTLTTADGRCGSALTLQYAFPQPVQFIRAFLPRLSLSAEVGQCVAHRWSGYAILFVPGITPAGKMQTIQEQLAKVFRTVDTTGDNIISVNETRDWLRNSASLVAAERGAFPQEHQELFLQFKAEDTVAYHDMNNDMLASRDEVLESLVQWNVVRLRMQEGLRLVNVADRAGLEAFERSLDTMRREPVELPRKLRPELEDLFSLPVGTRILRSLEGVTSLSDTEFFSEARDRIQARLKRHRRENRARAGEL